MTGSPLEFYGVTEFSARSRINDILTRKGYFISRFSDECLWKEVASSMNALINSDSYSIQLKSGTKRAPLIGDINMLRLIICDQVLQIVADASAFIDLNQQNVIFPTSEHGQDRWHRDIPYQDWVPQGGLAAINILFSFSPGNASSAALELIEGSHSANAFPCNESVKDLLKTVHLSPYEFLVMNSFMFHRAPKNQNNCVLINQVFAPKIFSQQIDLNSLPRRRSIIGKLKMLGLDEDKRIISMLGLDRKRYE